MSPPDCFFAQHFHDLITRGAGAGFLPTEGSVRTFFTGAIKRITADGKHLTVLSAEMLRGNPVFLHTALTGFSCIIAATACSVSERAAVVVMSRNSEVGSVSQSIY